MSLTETDVVQRTPLVTEGYSGASLHRVTTADGRGHVTKEIDPRRDWLVQATGDDGRIGRLWAAGLLSRLPDGLDSAIEHVETLPGRWTVVMRDVTDGLTGVDRLLTRAEARRFVTAAGTLHAAFAGNWIAGLCPLVDRLAMLTPKVVKATPDNPLAGDVLSGWDRFFDLAPAAVGAIMEDVLDRPGRLAAALGAHRATLLHGDLKVANIAFEPDNVVLLDWGTLTGMGPAAVDFAWHLAVNGGAIDATLDELLADVCAVLAPEDVDALPLSMLYALVQLGWAKALYATSGDEDQQRRERTGLDWWCRRAADALDGWPRP